jgi:tetratricopeptide (TPR) repeat protein
MSTSWYRLTVQFRAPVLMCFLTAACVCELAGQVIESPLSTDSTIHAHFAAAQQAQERNDYATAEREYKAVLVLTPGFAEAHMNLGLVYQLQNRIAEAMTEFSRALLIKPTLAGANFFLGVDYCKVGEGAKAIPYLKAAARREPNRPDIWSWLATAQEMTGDVQAEVVTVKRGLNLQPQNVDLLYLLGHAYERLGKEEVMGLQKVASGSSRSEQLLAESYAASSEWPLAVIHFQNALAASPGGHGLHAELGEVYLRAGKLRQATGEFEEELRLDPHSVRALVRRGETKLMQGDVEGSLADWAQAIDIDRPQAEQVLGMRETGLGDAALEQLPDASREKIETLAPDLTSRNTPAAHFALAFLAMQRGDSSEALSELIRGGSANTARVAPGRCSETAVQQALEAGRVSRVAPCITRLLSSRSAATLRTRLARGLLEAGDYEGSFKILNSLAPSNRHSPEVSYLRARCYEKLATAAYLRLYQADSNSYRVHQLMGDLDAAKGDDGKAMDEYRAAIALKPALPNLHYSLGHLLWKDLKVADARVELEAELALNPRHAGALNDLGNTYLLEHEPQQAMPYLKRALAADTGNPDIHRDLGTAYFQLYDYRNAEAEFKIAIAGDHDGSVHYKLARVYQALGEKDKAAHEFDLSAALNRESHSKLEKQTERLSQIEKLSKDP